ncbi:MAG: hypothetical protein E6917_12330 [Clostridium botulinum]|nr:hypothetical protein [Clostridium botulinum]
MAIFFCFNSKVLAFDDKFEPNNTQESAIEIERNNNNDFYKSPKYILYSINGSNDEDWYSVFLKEGEETLTLQSFHKDLSAEVVSKDGKKLLQNTVFDPTTKKQAKFKVAQTGTYYIHIKNNNGSYSEQAEYRLTIGLPVYTVKYYTVEFNNFVSVNSRTGKSNIVTFDLTNNSKIPEDAVLMAVSIGGRESGTAYSRTRSIRAANQNRWIDTTEFLFKKDNLIYPYPIKLKQRWQFKHEAGELLSNSYALKPCIYITYQTEAFK